VEEMQAQFDELAPHMRKGYLYAFPYPSHDRASDLKKIMAFVTGGTNGEDT
jgi:hypothetical protein